MTDKDYEQAQADKRAKGQARYAAIWFPFLGFLVVMQFYWLAWILGDQPIPFTTILRITLPSLLMAALVTFVIINNKERRAWPTGLTMMLFPAFWCLVAAIYSLLIWVYDDNRAHMIPPATIFHIAVPSLFISGLFSFLSKEAEEETIMDEKIAKTEREMEQKRQREMGREMPMPKK